MTKHFGVPDHPVCGAKVGCAAFFLMPQPPLLYQEGSWQPPIPFGNTPENATPLATSQPVGQNETQEREYGSLSHQVVEVSVIFIAHVFEQFHIWKQG
jgi:hypothetical protein